MTNPQPKIPVAVRRWQKRIEAYNSGEPIPESIIGALRKCFRSGTEEVQAIVCDADPCVWPPMTGGWRITSEQTEKGLKWLKSREIQRKLTLAQVAIVDDFSHFEFVGVKAELQRTVFFRPDYRPVYRVYAKNGKWFDYLSSPWQDGHWNGGSAPNRFRVIGGVQ